jgi:hypothetical protein
MTDAAAALPRRPQLAATPGLAIALSYVALAGLAVLLAHAVPALDKWPAEWVVPVRDWVTAFFAWFAGLLKPVTRGIAWLLAGSGHRCPGR